MLLMPKFTRVCIKTMPQPIEKHGLRANSVLSLDHWQCGCNDALPALEVVICGVECDF